MRKFKLLLFDLFFIVSGVIGVGFATGKEIAHFFLGGRSLWIAVGVFFVVFVALSVYILRIKHKHGITDLTQLNKFAFGKYYEIGNIVLIVLFVVTNAAMLAGCDNIVKNYLGITIPFASLFLSAITFFIVLGGVDCIKRIANVIMPVLILIIVANACCNFGNSANLDGNIAMDIAYPIIFCSENFITLISVLVSAKSKPATLSIWSGLVIAGVVAISAVAIGSTSTDMPMLTLSKNLGNVFFAVYLLGVIFALFTTLEISSYHCLQVSTKSKKHKYFTLSIIMLTSQIIAYLGFNFIVEYLYSAIGILGAIYLIALIVRLTIEDKKFK